MASVIVSVLALIGAFIAPAWSESRIIDPRDYGAVGDGRTDDTVALKKSLTALKPGGTLWIAPETVFTHSDVLVVDVPGATITGGGTLLATREERSSIWLAADDIHIESVTLRLDDSSKRWTAYEQMKLRLMPVRGVVVSDVAIVGAAAAGVYVGGASDFVLSDLTVEGTRADGIHVTEGASDGRVSNAYVRDSGDDGIAVVSYARRQPCRNILVDGPRVTDQRFGRGLTVVGGSDITFSDVFVKRSWGAGIYIAAEQESNTHGIRNVRIQGGLIISANSGEVVHGALVVYNSQSQKSIEGVSVTDLAIRKTQANGDTDIRVTNYGGGVFDVAFDRIKIAQGPKWSVFTTPDITKRALSLARVTKRGVRVQWKDVAVEA